jgi:beta-glucosidase
VKKALKIILYAILSLIGLILLVLLVSYLWISVSVGNRARKALTFACPEVKTVMVDGHEFCDLNKNGSLDIYEDTRRCENLTPVVKVIYIYAI